VGSVTNDNGWLDVIVLTKIFIKCEVLMFFHPIFMYVWRGVGVCMWIHKEISGFIKFILQASRNNNFRDEV
jgi:hypothetical protein